MRKKKTTKIFLCHSSDDKPFVRRLANELKSFGVDVWFDEWEMKVGDSLREKIERGISKSSYLGIILSKKSTRSKWVRREINAAFAKELQSNKIFISLLAQKGRCSASAGWVGEYSKFRLSLSILLLNFNNCVSSFLAIPNRSTQV